MTNGYSKINGPHADSAKGRMRAGWDKLWQVADSYDWTGGKARPATYAKIGVYSPLAYREIVTNLAKVAEGRERLDDWVSAYGMLNWGSERDQISGDMEKYAESRVEFMRFADEVRGAVEAVIELNREPSAENANRVTKLIQPGLKRIHPILTRSGSGDSAWKINIAWQFPTLKDVIMLHLADLATEEEGNVRRCDACGSHFVATHGKQRFCPPLKGATWNERSKTRESRCALRSRQRRQRARKATK